MALSMKMKVAQSIPRDLSPATFHTEYHLRPVADESNKAWSKQKPAALFQMSVTNPKCDHGLELGAEYIVTFQKVTKQQPAKKPETK